MKISGINLIRRTCRFERSYVSETRQANKIDIYREYADEAQNIRPVKEDEKGTRTGLFIEILTDEGITGQYGVLEFRPEAFTIMDGLADYLIGRDPLENRLQW